MNWADPFFQIVVTFWLSVHPVTYTFPKIYWSKQECTERIEAQIKLVKRHNHLELQCVRTGKRDI